MDTKSLYSLVNYNKDLPFRRPILVFHINTKLCNFDEEVTKINKNFADKGESEAYVFVFLRTDNPSKVEFL